MSTSSARAADRARNSELEAEVLYLERIISALRIEQAAIQERLGSYTYPVLTLPNEIISEIFTQFLPIYPLCPPIVGLLSPTSLTHICHKWREIALATPRLWSAISLCYMGDNTNTLQQLDMQKAWLRRSGSCPLSIQMDGSGFIAQILATIIPHRARWEYVKFSNISLRDLDMIEGPLPLLRDLDVTLYNRIGPHPAATFRQAPRLRVFTDTRLYDEFTYSPDFLPWFQLTSVTLVLVTPAECTPVLMHTVNLVHCQLAMTDGVLNQPDIKLLSLESLVLVKFDPAEEVQLTEYLNTFVVPALQRLQVPDEFLGPTPVAILESFISKSGCKLEEVCITGERSLPRESYRNVFPSIPNFTFNRALTHWDDNDDFDDGEPEESGDESE
ncbi:hypothetical protein C8R44DRAFT_856077 [Mycena epipterygia]|nr:hypothetical protein C8R44DRAFT_856077 [Mycena epipterygia]